jgi:taurine dioxygenase
MTSTVSGFRLRPASPACGAYVEEIDLRAELPSEVIDALEVALHDHGVLFFRDQPLTPAEHVRFAARFGPLHIHPYVRNLGPEHPEVIVLDETARGGVQWHTDSTYEDLPAYGSVLKMEQLPSAGGDTVWASMYAAYDGLSPAMQRMLEELHAVHSISKVRDRQPQREFTSQPLSAVHPAVITDPVSGRRALFVNDSYTLRFQELSQLENEKVLELLREHVKAPEYQVRLQWETDTIAFWLNPITQHYPVADYDEPRRVHRVTIQLTERPKLVPRP